MASIDGSCRKPTAPLKVGPFALTAPPWLLNRLGTLSASHAVHGEAIRARHIFVAPPDHHMTIEAGKITLTKGPRENLARPAIDPMFPSSARTYGADIIGVILSCSDAKRWVARREIIDGIDAH